jgi:hypothetical protein
MRQAYYMGCSVGFADYLPFYQELGLARMSRAGLRELSGFNACFARADELSALVCRSDVSSVQFAVELHSSKDTIVGLLSIPILHLGQGCTVRARDGRRLSSPVSCVLKAAEEHYQADLTNMYIHVLPTLETLNKKFKNLEDMSMRFPGWRDRGFIRSTQGLSLLDYHDTEKIFDEHVEWQVLLRQAVLSSALQVFYDLNISAHTMRLSIADALQISQQQGGAGTNMGDLEAPNLGPQDVYIIMHRQQLDSFR